ncbi:MAG: divalent-cation tolerance protein CutA [Silvibacterium sp.]
MTSVYSWQGAIETAHEVLMLIKTSAERLPELETALREMHSYDVPEFVVIALESGNQAYLDWLAAAVAPLSP